MQLSLPPPPSSNTQTCLLSNVRVHFEALFSHPVNTNTIKINTTSVGHFKCCVAISQHNTLLINTQGQKLNNKYPHADIENDGGKSELE